MGSQDPSNRTRTGRRRFLLVAGGTLGAGAAACAGLALVDSPELGVDFAQGTYGEASAMRDSILVTYASEKGSTGGVAEAIGERLAAGGATVDVRRVGDVADLSGYRAVVVGSAIHGGKWLPEAIEFVRANQGRFRQVPTAYFLVSMMVAKGSDKWGVDVATWLEPVRSLVSPVAEGFFGGVVRLNQYRFVDRLGMRIFLASIGLPEGDYRDWEAIRAWADRVRPLLLG